MPVQSSNIPELTTLEQWKGLNQQVRRGSIDDQEEFWNENFYATGPGLLRSCWGPSAPIYTAPAGKVILRIFFGFIGLGQTLFSLPPAGRMGYMFLSDGTVDQVDLDTGAVTTLPGQVWEPVAPYYWASLKVWRPQYIGNIIGQVGGLLIGSPLGLFAWDGTTLYRPLDPAPEWLTGIQDTPQIMPTGLPGILCMEVFQQTLFVAGKDVIAYSAPNNGSDFSATGGGGTIGYLGDKLVASYMDLAASAGYLYCFGDSSTDAIFGLQTQGGSTGAVPTAPVTVFQYANIDPQVGHGFPRPVGRWGRYFVMANGDPRNAGGAVDTPIPPTPINPIPDTFRGGLYLMYGGDAQVISQKVTNIYTTLDTGPPGFASSVYPTFAPMTMWGYRIMLCNGVFTDPWGVKRNLLLAWDGQKWTVMTQNLNLTNIGSYEDFSVITAYGTDGTYLYRLFDHPDQKLQKRLSTKQLRGSGHAQITLKDFKRLFLEIHDLFGGGVSLTGQITGGDGGVPGGAQEIGFDLAEGKQSGIEPMATNAKGIWATIDLTSHSPDFILERLHVLAEERTLWGA